MFKAEVDLRNMEGFDAQFAEVAEAVNKNLDEVADLVLSEAQKSSAFADKTGKLRKSIKKKKSKFEDGGYIVFSKDPKAHLVELGHVLILFGKTTGKRVPPHPYLRPALDQGIRRAIQLFRNKK